MKETKIFKVAYNPNISSECQYLIRKNISASMINTDESSTQYNLDFTINILKDIMSNKDLKELKFLQKQEVEFIEF